MTEEILMIDRLSEANILLEDSTLYFQHFVVTNDFEKLMEGLKLMIGAMKLIENYQSIGNKIINNGVVGIQNVENPAIEGSTARFGDQAATQGAETPPDALPEAKIN